MVEKKIIHVRGWYMKRTGHHVKPFTRTISKMSRMSPLFGKSIRIQRGAMGGWHASDPASKRQAILTRTALREGYNVTAKRLVFLKNISNVPKVDAAVKEDLAWLQKKFRGW
jgi:hypothetical protein